MSDRVFLNLGCGGAIAEGWVNVDRGCGPGIYCMDLTDPWPWEKQSVDGIVMHHVLDLFDDDGYWHVVDESARVLKLGGVLRVSLANLNLGIRKAMAGEWDWFAEPKISDVCEGQGIGWVPEFDAAKTLGFFITQGGARKQWYDRHDLCESLETTFAHVYAVPYRMTNGDPKMIELDSREAESFIVEAIR